MYKVKLLNSISNAVYNYLDNNQITKSDDDADAIIVRSADMHSYTLGDNVKAIARAGAGVNNIPVDELARRGIFVFNTPGANANAVKELTILALLLSCRQVYRGVNWVQSLTSGGNVPKEVESGKKAFEGPELLNKTLGIIGYGAIGKLVAETALALGMNLIICSRSLLQQDVDKNRVTVTRNREDVFKNADFITLHIPETSDTKNTINKNALGLMKNGVRIINTARGGLVNDQDLIDGITSGKVACYVTDFPNQNLIGNNAVITIPHLGASTPESEDNCAAMASFEINEFITKGNAINSVNLPNLAMAESGEYRYTVLVNKDKSDEIKTLVESYNPIMMKRADKNGYVYFIADFDKKQDITPTDAIRDRWIVIKK